jgi:predicted N-acetyltransferase YhbS
MIILDALATGGLLTVLFLAALGLGFAWALDWPSKSRLWIISGALALIPLSQVLPATSVFRQQIAQSVGALLFMAAFIVPVGLYFVVIRRLRRRADESAASAAPPPRQGLGLIEDDAALNADMHAKLVEMNSAYVGPTRPCFSIVYRDETGQIVGSARVALLAQRAELRTLWVEQDTRRDGVGSIVVRAAEEEARARGAALMVLFTFSWQSPAFYERLGYERTHTRAVPGAGEEYFYEKTL